MLFSIVEDLIFTLFTVTLVKIILERISLRDTEAVFEESLFKR